MLMRLCRYSAQVVSQGLFTIYITKHFVFLLVLTTVLCIQL